MFCNVIKQLEMMNVHQSNIVYIDVYINNYRLTQLSITMDDECHEYSHHFWNRRWLHNRGAIVAGDEVAPRQCLVGTRDPHQLNPTRNYRFGRTDMEPLAQSWVALEFPGTFQRLGVSRHYLRFLDIRLLLVASIS